MEYQIIVSMTVGRAEGKKSIGKGMGETWVEQ